MYKGLLTMNLLKKSILIVAAITIIGVGAFFVWYYLNAPEETKNNADDITVDELVEISVDTEIISTNLADGKFIKAKFKIITKSKKTAEEVEKLNFRVENTIIKSLNSLTKEQVIGLDGLTAIEKNLKKELNKEFDSKDSITRVYIVESIVQ
jgi:flagellar protein FliL